MYPMSWVREMERIGHFLGEVGKGLVILVVVLCMEGPALALMLGLGLLLEKIQGAWYTIPLFFVGTAAIIGVGFFTFLLARRRIFKKWFDDILSSR